jgi:hypothetical protein
MRPPDSSKPFLLNGISYRNTLQLYLILEMAMTLMAVAQALLMSESFLSRDRLPLVFFTGSIKGKRQVSVMSSAMNDTRELARSKLCVGSSVT